MVVMLISSHPAVLLPLLSGALCVGGCDCAPQSLLERLRASKSMFAALDMQQQLTLARLDQAYHRATPTELEEGWDSTAVYRTVYEECMPAAVRPHHTHTESTEENYDPCCSVSVFVCD